MKKEESFRRHGEVRTREKLQKYNTNGNITGDYVRIIFCAVLDLLLNGKVELNFSYILILHSHVGKHY